MMRKWLAAVLCAALLMNIAPAFAVTAEEVTGVWYLRHLKVLGVNAAPESMGMELTMTLHADGTARLDGNLAAVEPTATWALDGTTLTVGDLAFTCRDGQLTAETENGGMGLTLVMTREPAREEAEPDAPVNMMAEWVDFEGCWEAVSVQLATVAFPVEQTGLAMRLIVYHESVAVTSGKDTATLPVLAIVDGKLMFGAEKAAIMTAALMEDGTLRLMQETGCIVFEKRPMSEDWAAEAPDDDELEIVEETEADDIDMEETPDTPAEDATEGAVG